MAILVCGGAGYIGSHTVKELIGKYEVIVLDNLSTGHAFLLNERIKLVVGDIGDENILDSIFTEYQIDVVFHFAANSVVKESVDTPLEYYRNNVNSTVTLFRKMVEHNVGKIIFSSTAAVYGLPDEDIITEETVTNPINPYGKSKLMVEEILKDTAHAYGLHYIILRYFNAAGAHISGEIGEIHEPETHLIPIILKHLLGEVDKISIFGTNYKTHDGSCVRDYIHVSDLAAAHVLAYESLVKGNVRNQIYNLGTGTGYSVKEIINICEKVSGKKAIVEYAVRRPGDPDKLVTSAMKINETLGWKPNFTIQKVIESAWRWHSNTDTKKSVYMR